MKQYSYNSLPALQRGLSLVELLIAIALGLFLVWGAMQAYLTSKQTYSMQQSLSRVQETGRMAHEFLSFDIRNAGNTGCGTNNLQENADTGDGCADGVNMLEGDTTIDLDFSNSVYGVDDVDGSATAGQAFSGAGLDPAPKKGTDMFVVRGSFSSGVRLTDTAKANDANFTVNVVSDDGNGCYSGMCPGDILVVTDCVKSKIFQATKLNQSGELVLHDKSGQNKCAAWGGNGANAPAFNDGAQILKMSSTFYYVADNPDGRPALYKRGLTGAAVELLEGVEDMQLEFGIGENLGDGYVIKEYKTANNVNPNEWDAWDGDDFAVIAVRYSLLVRSEDSGLDAPQVYSFNGKDYVGGVEGTAIAADSDRRLRQVFTSTVGLRNRVR